MSDRMRLLPFDKLIQWALSENERENSIFGISDNKYFKKSGTNHLSFFGQKLENPLGPAAGPHTQLAQNIIAAYIAGARFFELKTVQIIDGEDLPVAKPCILAKEEGYNVEWSTELTVPEALNEYIKAWFALNILSKELSLGSSMGFIFNMSVGYDLEGIKSPKINSFIDSLKDASQTAIWKECRDFLLDQIDIFKNISKEYIDEISSNVCQSITLSTLHGCPPAEIERIARYLLVEKKLHTYVKCNPTLLGYEFSRNTLDKLGYDYLVFDDHHFKNDLQYDEAVPMLARLKALAKDLGLTFGVKLTNTFPVKIMNKELPGEEMYLSGKPLYSLTINLAYRLAKEFDGDIRISYSGGADFNNISAIYKTGIWPITFATTLLKPGGYVRLKQLADLLETEQQGPEFKGVDVRRLQILAEEAVTDVNYKKIEFKTPRTKLNKKVPLTDCFIAPCKNACPIGQDIPEYIRLVGEGRYLDAFEVIIAKNPLPFITGTLCTHRCMTSCTRQYYDESVGIRTTKLLAAQKAYEEFISTLDKPDINSSFKVAVIGGGPAGLSAAYFLRRNGIDVTVFEKRNEIGGIIQHIAPDFRISQEAVQKDMELIKKIGVEFCLGVDEDFSIEDLKKKGFKYIFIAIGAEKPIYPVLEACDKEIMNVLEFLEAYKKSPGNLRLGKTVAVIGAGNSAMDAARAAKRVAGVENVYIVYRRTRKYMPAEEEELVSAIEEGIRFMELLTPVAFDKGILRCQRMELGAPDAFGRKSPVAISGEYSELSMDSIITAVGEQVETELFVQNKIELTSKGRVRVNPVTNETNLENVFIGGDALRGPATIVEAIADGTKFAEMIMEREKGQQLTLEKAVVFDVEKQIEEIRGKKGVIRNICNPDLENNRCLECHKVCNMCVEVCPNRANLAVKVPISNAKCVNQIIHIDGMCNECGNCEAFCPYDSAPYKEKLTLYWNLEDFLESTNTGFLLLDKSSGLFRIRYENNVMDATFDRFGNCNGDIPKDIAEVIWSVYKNYAYIVELSEENVSYNDLRQSFRI